MCHLKHKYIIGFYGFFWDADRIYLMLEYAYGGELFGDMRRYPSHRYDEATAARYVGQLAECLYSLFVILWDFFFNFIENF